MSSALIARARSVLQSPWTRNPTLGLGLIIGSIAVVVLIGFLGPSAVALRLGPRTSLMPPWYLPTGLIPVNEWVAVISLWLGLAAGSIGLWVCYRAVDAGWRPNIRKLFLLGVLLCTATSLVLPLTSADVLMYAAYGRLMVLGWNPYDITPANISVSGSLWAWAQIDQIMIGFMIVNSTARVWKDGSPCAILTVMKPTTRNGIRANICSQKTT